MANPSLLDAINRTLTPNSWAGHCIAQLNGSSDFTWQEGLVDGSGRPLAGLTDGAWGVTVSTCYKYCNMDRIPYSKDFNFQAFSASMTNYFLPWLALTAQLPFETGDPWSNAMSFFLAVGSPSLITFSLTLTILNRFWVRKTFEGLYKKARSLTIKSRFNEYAARVRALQYLLQEAQQVPLRAAQDQGWLSSLLVNPGNTEWWTHLQDRLKSTRRGFTASLAAQILLAVLAYLFTVISSFLAALGDPATALQIASGSLWIWLIPVILGWITVGTQYSDHSIGDALVAERAYRALEESVQAPGQPTVFDAHEEQLALEVRSGLTPMVDLDHRTLAATRTFTAPDTARLQVPTWLGARVEGDEMQKGPTFNYARLFTWWRLASTLDLSLFQTLERVKEGRVLPNFQRQTAGNAWDNHAGAANLSGDSLDTAQYCGLNAHVVKAYPTWSEMPAGVYRRLFAAAIAALFVQWGTTGASIMIAYQTPVVGFGCRSASYTLYGAMGTATWLFLLVSMMLSHAVMLRYQAVYKDRPTVDFRIKRVKGQPADPDLYTRTLGHSILCAAAVITRYIGKSLAFINTNVLILSSILEFIGLFDNCWCEGNAFGMGVNGWVLLFKDANNLAVYAASSWGGGLAMTLIVCVVSYVFFALGSLKTDDD